MNTKNTTTATMIRTGATILALGAALAGGVSSAQAQPKMAPSKMAPRMSAGTSASGTFQQVTHATRGTAAIAGRKLTLSNFATGMGPALHVYLVRGSGLSSNGAIKSAIAAHTYLDLGTCKSIRGSQSCALPNGAQAKGSTLVIWCDKFDVAFGSATLS